MLWILRIMVDVDDDHPLRGDGDTHNYTTIHGRNVTVVPNIYLPKYIFTVHKQQHI